MMLYERADLGDVSVKKGDKQLFSLATSCMSS